MKYLPLIFLLLFQITLWSQSRVIITATAADTIADESFVHIGSGGDIYPAEADMPGMEATAYCLVGGLPGATIQVFKNGVFETPIASDAGDLIYLSNAPGACTITQTAGTSQVVAHAVTDTEMILEFQASSVSSWGYNYVTSTSSPQLLKINQDNLIDQGGTQATFTFNLPASPHDGATVDLTFNNAVTVVVVSGGATAVNGTALTAAAIGSRATYKYYASASAWIRIQ